MKKFLSFTLLLTLSVILVFASIASASDLQPSSWSNSGPGTSITSNPDGSLNFIYNIEDESMWDGVNWLFESTADTTGTFEYNWNYSWFHAWYGASANVVAFANGPDGEQTVTIYNYNYWEGGALPSGSGSSILNLHEGYSYGFRILGSNYDWNPFGQGTLTINVPDTTQPDVTVSAKTADNASYTEGTWTNQDVTISFTATDCNLKSLTVGGETVTASAGQAAKDVNVSTEGATILNYTAEDSAGNITTGSFQANIDKTAPEIKIDGVSYDGTDDIYLGYIATGFDKKVNYNYTDNLSGYTIAPNVGDLEVSGLEFDLNTDNYGLNQTQSETIVDQAGNTTVLNFTYNVISVNDIMALLKPLQNGGDYKINSTIPIKLQILEENEAGTLEPVPMSAYNLTFMLELSGPNGIVVPTRTNTVTELENAQFMLSADNLTYQYNLKTKDLDKGSYTIKIYIIGKTAEEGLVGTIDFKLHK